MRRRLENLEACLAYVLRELRATSLNGHDERFWRELFELLRSGR